MGSRPPPPHAPPPPPPAVPRRALDRWSTSHERAELLAIYAEVDALVAGWTCSCSRSDRVIDDVRCCHFAVNGREPYPTPVELAEVHHGVRLAGVAPRARRKLPIAAEWGTCPLLSDEGLCRIYASRPFGCRTFFCDHAEAPLGARGKPPRDAMRALGRRIADLSARFAPRDPRPRPLVRALRIER